MKKLIFILLLTILNYSCQKDNPEPFPYLIDTRDNYRVYKIIKIGDQIWMAENLAYDLGNGCWAYNDDEENVKIYGRLYTWSAAKRACPSGWHLPTVNEWEQLAKFISDQNGGYIETKNGWDNVGNHLKAKSGWADNGNGTDDYGFTGLPGGSCWNFDSFKNFYDVEFNGYWWTSTEISPQDAHARCLTYDNDKFRPYHILGNKGIGYSVRCLKD